VEKLLPNPSQKIASHRITFGRGKLPCVGSAGAELPPVDDKEAAGEGGGVGAQQALGAVPVEPASRQLPVQLQEGGEVKNSNGKSIGHWDHPPLLG
jgi:hypothetical protein